MADEVRAPWSGTAWLVRGVGAAALAAGLGVAILAPLELYCFYLFAEGGEFHYPGFGVGSFMFGNIAAQVAGYYALAAMLVPLGYGHLLGRRWAATLGEGLLGAWWVAGLPLIVAFLAVLLASKDVTPAAAAATALFLVAAYPALALLGRRFYESPGVRRALGGEVASPRDLDTIPPRIVTLGVLYGLVLVTWHVLILFRGLFPVYGAWATGVTGIALLDAAILLLATLTWGTLRRRRWAWWGGLAYFSLVGLSWVVTLAGSSWAELLAALELPQRELEMLGNVPLKGYHLAPVVGLPLALLLWQVARARGAFPRSQG